MNMIGTLRFFVHAIVLALGYATRLFLHNLGMSDTPDPRATRSP
jgi:hypothetical protein